MEITVKPEFEKLVPPLQAAEQMNLYASLMEKGCQMPLVVWKEKGILLDGHHRYAFCQKHGLAFETIQESLPNEDAAIERIIKGQFETRQMTEWERVVTALKLKPVLAKRAKESQGTRTDIVSNRTQSEERGRVREQIAKMAGVGTGTVARVEWLLKHGRKETKAKLWNRDKNTTPNRGYDEDRSWLKKQDRLAELEDQAELEAGKPDGLFHVLVIDPPWPYGTGYDPQGRRAANPYPEMSLEEIGALELPAADDCILWLWTTHQFMRHTFELLDKWGFEEKAIVTWVKDKMGLGTWLRSQSEFCIMAVKGKPPINLTNQTTVINGPLREHSRKPDEFYQMVDTLCVGRKLDYFSREARDGWEQFGKETEKFVGEQSDS